MSENEKIKEMMINLEVLTNILGEERIQAIAEEALKDHLQWYLRDRRNLERIVYDISKKFALQYIAEECGTEMHKECAEAIRNTLNKEGGIAYYMFSDNPEGKKILDEEIDNARPYMREAIHKTMDRYAINLDRDDLEQMVWEYIINKMFAEKAGEEYLKAAGEE